MRKKLFVSGVAALFLAGIVFAATWTTGTGKIVTVTTAHQRVALTTTVNTLSIYVSDANRVFALVNCTTNDLVTRMAAGTAIPIPGPGSYTFDAQENASIESVCLATTNGTAVCLIGGY